MSVIEIKIAKYIKLPNTLCILHLPHLPHSPNSTMILMLYVHVPVYMYMYMYVFYIMTTPTDRVIKVIQGTV